MVELPLALRAVGFNAFGVLAPDRYDALVPEAWRVASVFPEARSVLMLATGGPAFFRAFSGSAGALREAAHPLDAFTDAQLRRGAAEWGEAGFETRSLGYWVRRGEPPAFADFVALGLACGLGTPSRLGLLLHPEFGPWWAIRGLWLTTRALSPTQPIAGAGPCTGCPAPCRVACPVAAPEPEGFDALRCRSERERSDACRRRCDARHACVVGREHAYPADAEAHHMRAALDWASPADEG